MKKTVLLAFIACLLTTSCEKIVGDLDFLNHDMAIQGTVNPTLGVPIAHGSVSIHDVLNMVQVTVADVEVDDATGLISIVYDTVETFTVEFEDAKSWKKPEESSKRRTGIYTDTTHNTIQGSIHLDIFNQIDSVIENAAIEIGNLYVSLGAYVLADAREDALALMDTFDVSVYYDSLYIIAIGKDGKEFKKQFPNIIIPADSLILGHRFQLFYKEDISQIVNIRPVEIQYGTRMNVAFGTDFWKADLTQSEFVSDSIGIKSIDITADIKVEFPLATYLKDISYSTDLAYSNSLDFKELKIDSSMIIIKCENGIPLELGLTAILRDSLDNDLCSILDPTPTRLVGAPVINDGTGRFISNGKSKTEIHIPVTAAVFDNLLKSNKIHLDATLNTSPTGSASNKSVSIRATDLLDIAVSAKIQPSYPLDIDLDDDNDKKGGVR